MNDILHAIRSISIGCEQNENILGDKIISLGIYKYTSKKIKGAAMLVEERTMVQIGG